MPGFGSPFSGLANDRNLTHEEVVKAIRFMVAAEYEATQLYLQLPLNNSATLFSCFAIPTQSHRVTSV